MQAVGVVCFCLLVAGSRAVPLSMVMNSPGILIPNALDDGSDASGKESNNVEDDFTAHPLERLSSAATCLVAGVEYTHGQQIYRKDQCEFCLCLDGEMFCWWQDCPPTLEGPCKDRGPFTPCQNGNLFKTKKTSATASSPSSASSSSSSSAASAGKAVLSSTGMPSTPTATMPHLIPPKNSPAVVPTEEASVSSADDQATSTESLPTESGTSTDVPQACIVMGRQYNIGDRLPHDTGNCVECVCGRGAQIACSPHQCAPSNVDDDVDEIDDYRPPGLRSAQPDVF